MTAPQRGIDINVSGAAGRAGAPGFNAWQAGGHGGDAGAAQVGGAGGNLDVVLTSEAPRQVRVSGTQRGGQSVAPWDRVISLRSDGGAGGDGGCGGNGAPGLPGRDADGQTPGMPGGPGQRGGDGGRGSNGAAGGAGGSITVSVRAADLDLLVGVQTLARGGPGGCAGRHGEPGAGGRGGRGGRSFSPGSLHDRLGGPQHRHSCLQRPGHGVFQPLRSYSDCDVAHGCNFDLHGSPLLRHGRLQPSCSSHQGHHSRHGGHQHRHSYLDAGCHGFPQLGHGGLQPPCSSHSGLAVQPRVAAGSQGLPGLAGQQPQVLLHPGAQGAPGSVQWLVTDMAAPPYLSRFHLVLSGLHLVSADGHEALAFGDTVHTRLRMCNQALMPSPAHTDIEAVLADDPLFAPEPGPRPPALLPRDLRHSMPHDVAGPSFCIRWPEQPARGERRIAQGQVRLGLRAARTGMALEEGRATRAFTVSYPLEVASLQWQSVATAAAPAAISWSVRTVSHRVLGGDMQAVEIRLRHEGGDAAGRHVWFQLAGSEQAVHLQEAFCLRLETLQPDAAPWVFRGTVRFDAATRSHARADLVVSLHLADRPGGLPHRAIQERPFAVQLGVAYVRDPHKELLLVVNSRTTAAEVRAWEQLAAEMQTGGVSIWNVSLYGALSLTEAVASHDLHEDARKKTIVVLNNPYDTDVGEKTAAGFLGRGGLLRAARAGIATYVLSPAAVDFVGLLRPAAALHPVEHGSLADFKAAVAGRRAGVQRLPLGSDRFPVQVSSLFKGLGRRYLLRQAQRAAALLEDADPERLYALDVRVDLQLVGPRHPLRPWALRGFGKAWQLGTIQVTRGLDVAARALTACVVPEAQMHGREFVLGPANREALCRALRFDRKLALLAALVDGHDGDSPIMQPLLRGIVADLREEQYALRQRPWRGALHPSRIPGKLPRLQALCQHTLTQARCQRGRRGGVLARLYGEVQSLVSHHWAGQLLPWRRDADVDRATARMVGTLSQQLFGRRLPLSPGGCAAAPAGPHAQIETDYTQRSAVTAARLHEAQADM